MFFNKNQFDLNSFLYRFNLCQKRKKQNIMKKLLILALLISLFSYNATSSHIVGGDTKFEQIGPNQFKVTFRLIRYCNGIAAPIALTNAKIFDKGTNFMVSQFTATLDTMITFITAGSLVTCVEDYTFSDTVNLPNNPNGYYVSWGTCCRALTIMNHGANSYLWTCDIPDPAIAGGNSSPSFIAYPSTVGLCVNNPINLDFSCIDPNGDSLVYSLVNPYNTTSSGGTKPFNLLAYNTGYSLLNILGPGGSCTINSATGIVTGNPAQQGIYVIAVKCEEFRNGFKIGEVIRDSEVPAVRCSLASKVELDLNNTISVYPNPNNGIFTVETSENTSMDVFDVYGKLVYSATLTNLRNKVDLNSFSSGIYTIKFTSNGQSVIKKIVLN